MRFELILKTVTGSVSACVVFSETFDKKRVEIKKLIQFFNGRGFNIVNSLSLSLALFRADGWRASSTHRLWRFTRRLQKLNLQEREGANRNKRKSFLCFWKALNLTRQNSSAQRQLWTGEPKKRVSDTAHNFNSNVAETWGQVFVNQIKTSYTVAKRKQ